MNWIKVKLEGIQSNRNGIGSRVEIVIDNVIQIQDVICGDSYSSQSSLALSFGARNKEEIDSITVKWPSGIIDTFSNIPVNQILTVLEGSGNNLSIEKMKPIDFSISSIYPNPFNPLTTIKFNVKDPQIYTISIYNLIGEQIEIISQRYYPSGNHSLQWKPEHQSSGLYIVQISSDIISVQSKLIFLK